MTFPRPTPHPLQLLVTCGLWAGREHCVASACKWQDRQGQLAPCSASWISARWLGMGGVLANSFTKCFLNALLPGTSPAQVDGMEASPVTCCSIWDTSSQLSSWQVGEDDTKISAHDQLGTGMSPNGTYVLHVHFLNGSPQLQGRDSPWGFILLAGQYNNHTHQTYICPANTALTSSHTAFSHPCSLPSPGHPSHCSGIGPDLTGGKGLTAPSSSTQVMIGSGMRQANKSMDLTKKKMVFKPPSPTMVMRAGMHF